MVAGWNAPNRLVIGRDVKPGPEDPARGLRHQRPDLESADELHLHALARASSSTRATRRRSRSRRPRSTSTVVRHDPAIDAIVRAEPEDLEAGRGLPVHRRPGLVAGGERAALLAIPTATSSGSTRPRGAAPRGVPRSRAATPAPTSRSTASPAPTASRSIAQGRLTIDQHGNRRVVAPRRRRRGDGARRPLRGQASQQPERPRLPVGRHALLHRSAVRPAEVLRRSAQGAAVQRRVRADAGRQAARS